jgi:hypothetical protein
MCVIKGQPVNFKGRGAMVSPPEADIVFSH